MSVKITYKIHEEVFDVAELIGGIGIYVDGHRVNQFEGAAEAFPLYEWQPEYVGEYIDTDFSRLMKVATRLASGAADIYEPVEESFSSLLEYFVFEPLSPEDLLIAYRTQISYTGRPDPPLTTPESARGYIVDRCEFCRAVSDAAHDFVSDVEAMPIDRNLELLETFEETLSKLDEALETCDQTRPEFPEPDDS